MKFINQKVKRIIQEPGIEGMYKHIDVCAGVCYGRTEPHEDSFDFVGKLVKQGHGRALELGSVYLKIPTTYLSHGRNKWLDTPFTQVHYEFDVNIAQTVLYITTNYRVIVEENLYNIMTNFWNDDAAKYCPRSTFKFTCTRAVADEFRTHTTLSSLMKSTRYCKVIGVAGETKTHTTLSSLTKNICSNKVNELEIIYPYYVQNSDEKELYEGYIRTLYNSLEDDYKFLRGRFKATPEEARDLLPLGMATELIQCGFDNMRGYGWQRFMEMRTAKNAHPQAQGLAMCVKDMLEKEEY